MKKYLFNKNEYILIEDEFEDNLRAYAYIKGRKMVVFDMWQKHLNLLEQIKQLV